MGSGGLTWSGSAARGWGAWAEDLAVRLYPHRTALVTVGLASFLVGVLPLVLVVHGRAVLADWHVVFFAACVPVVLWALCLAIHATFFDPTRGLVETLCRTAPARRRGVRALLRAYATLTVAAFAVAPVWVLVAAVA